MSRRFTIVTLTLTAVIAFLVGAIVAGGLSRPAVNADTPAPRWTPATKVSNVGEPGSVSLVNFADIVERINPAVVNIDATARVSERRRRSRPGLPDAPEPFDFNPPRVLLTARKAAAPAPFVGDPVLNDARYYWRVWTDQHGRHIAGDAELTWRFGTPS